MVPVGDVGARNLVQHGADGLDGLGAHDLPDALAHALAVGEVVERRSGLGGFDDHIEHGLVAIREEDGARLASDRADVLDTVALLVFAGELVTLDDALLVLVNRAHARDAGLNTALPRELVDIVGAVSVLDVHAVIDALPQELRAAPVDLGRVHVLFGAELRFGPIDVEERERMGLRVRRCLGAVEDVVG